ncbi:MAG TPA: HAD family hydrolase [Steroidobacteraceae bacterium]|jgi:4-nitrophenyl phosphatase
MPRSRHGGGRSLPPIQGLVFDVDGTLLLSDRSLGGYELLPGAIETLSALRQQGFPFVLLTNGSAYAPGDQAAKMRAIGLPVDDAQMITPSSVTADHMRRTGIASALVLGVRGVGQALLEAGIETRYNGEPRATEVDAVYVGWHPQCGMPDIEAAARALWAGAKLYVGSNTPFFATKQGRTIGYSYTIVRAIRGLANVPMIVTGKPSQHALRFAAKALGLPARHIAVVGDDPTVETIMARRGGAVALGVTTGITSREQWARLTSTRRPHRVLGGLPEVLRFTGARSRSRRRPRPAPRRPR